MRALPEESRRAVEVLDRLLRMPELEGASLAVPGFREDPFHVLVSTIVSQRTRDPVTSRVSSELLARAPDAASMLALGRSRIEGLLAPAGFYRRKAGQLIALSGAIIDTHGGVVPADEAGLLALPGVGRKTAALVLSVAFDVPAICVDTHVHRISNRLGLVRTRRPAQTEAALARLLPPSRWSSVNPLMVRFGQLVCRPVRPRCPDCGLSSLCPSSSSRSRSQDSERSP
ncbi:endonuclease III [Candidatus Fermentibacterales bacterium]|nr:endonuclease III [Candidatus Fermentibacterales bacterium]